MIVNHQIIVSNINLTLCMLSLYDSSLTSASFCLSCVFVAASRMFVAMAVVNLLECLADGMHEKKREVTAGTEDD